MKKKISLLFTFMVMTCLLVCLGVNASAADELAATGQCGDNVYWNYDSTTGELVISGTGAMYDYGSNNSPFCESNIKSVIIKDSVTNIGNSMFVWCYYLESIIIPDSVITIGSSAFNCCINLTSIIIPSSVTSIGEGAFYKCYGLEDIIIPDGVKTIGSNAFYDTGYYRNSSNWENNVLYIGKYLINVAPSLLGSYTIKEGTKLIADSAFTNCDLTSVTIPGSVTRIGWSAFVNCTSLTSITIGDGVTDIDGSAFYNTGYYNNSSNWENDVLYIGKYLINATTSLSGSYTIKEGTKLIADNAFYDCNNLTSVTIPASVINISKLAFYHCDILINITVDENNEWYSNDSYGVLFNKDKSEIISYPTGNTALSYDIPNSVTSIKDYAFAGCSSLTSVTIPNSVTTIEEGAFRSCYNLTSIKIPDSITSIRTFAFDGCQGLTSITVDENNKYYSSDAVGVLFNKNKSEIIIYPEGNTALSYDIPNGVTSIKDYAFAGCSSLTSVTIPNSVTTIEESAFWYCNNLTNITISNSVTSIKDYAFAGCSSLTSVTIPDGVTSIEYSAFSGCSSLSSITIPDGVTSIEDYAFSGCTSLLSVTIPNSITSIGKGAFQGCSGLTSIKIPYSVTTIEDFAFNSCDTNETKRCCLRG